MKSASKAVAAEVQTSALRNLRDTVGFPREEGDLIETDVEVRPGRPRKGN